MTPLRPLGLGELLDRAVNFWRANWRALFFLMLVFQISELIVIKFSQAATRHFFPLMSGADVMALAAQQGRGDEADILAQPDGEIVKHGRSPLRHGPTLRHRR